MQELIDKLRSAETKQEMFELIEPLTVKQLYELAKTAKISLQKGLPKDYARNLIVGRFGLKIDNEIIMNIDLKIKKSRDMSEQDKEKDFETKDCK